MKDKISKIELGKQLGASLEIEIEGEYYWITVGLQKHDNLYKVYINKFNDDEMTGDLFDQDDEDDYRRFSNLKDAIDYIDKSTPLSINDLNSCKGRRVFNPKFA